MRSFFFLAIAAAILGGLFFLFKPGRLAEEPRVAALPQAAAPAAKAPNASSASTQPTAPGAPAPQPPAAQPPVPQPATAPAAPSAGPREVTLVVKAGKLVSGDPVIQVRQGDEVTLHITSDKADELHMHGYDRHAHIAAGGTATLKIRAERTGRFPFELHQSHLELGTLEVYPRP
jgi:FtsP/CotA-like multicopper oxidase with cupredoxin domain